MMCGEYGFKLTTASGVNLSAPSTPTWMSMRLERAKAMKGARCTASLYMGRVEKKMPHRRGFCTPPHTVNVIRDIPGLGNGQHSGSKRVAS